MFQEKLEISCGLADKKRFMMFGNNEESVINVQNILQICMKVLETAFVCLSSEYDMSKKEHFRIDQDFCQWKIQHISLKKSWHKRSIWREFKNEIYLFINS